MLWNPSAKTQHPALLDVRRDLRAVPSGACGPGLRPVAAARELRDFVRRYEVCWETEPRIEWHAGRRLPVGYDVRLFARHPRGFEADPAAPDSRRLQQNLAALAGHACPAEWPAGLAVRFQPEPVRLLLRPESEWAPEVAACLSLQHTGATFAEADDAQRGCVHEIEKRLAQLGARPRSWRAH